MKITHVIGAAALAAALTSLLSGQALAAAADKVAVAASTTDFLWCSQLTPLGGSSTIECDDLLNNDGATGGTVTDAALPITTMILQVPYKVSTSGDLIIDVNLECMLFNEVKSTKNGTPEVSTSTAGLLVFAVIDDDNVPDEPVVGPGADPTPAQAIGVITTETENFEDDSPEPAVRFCSRLVELEISGEGFATGDFVRALIASETTHGFKWVAPNPAATFGNNLFVSLVGVIDTGPVGGKQGTQVSGVGFGKRLMTVESVHLPRGGDSF
jgi:hypothetical protein